MSTIASLDRIGVGIDTARYGHRVSFLRPDRKPAAKPLTVMENRAGYQALQDRLNQLHEQHPTANFHVRIDAAGQYAVNLELFLRSLKLPMTISVGEPKRNKDLDTGEKGGKAVINGYILSYDARTTNPKTRTEGRRPEQLTNQSRTAIRVQGEGLSFVTKIQPTEVEGMTSLAPGLFDIAERVRSMFSHACA